MTYHYYFIMGEVPTLRLNSWTDNFAVYTQFLQQWLPMTRDITVYEYDSNNEFGSQEIQDYLLSVEMEDLDEIEDKLEIYNVDPFYGECDTCEQVLNRHENISDAKYVVYSQNHRDAWFLTDCSSYTDDLIRMFYESTKSIYEILRYTRIPGLKDLIDFVFGKYIYRFMLANVTDISEPNDEQRKLLKLSDDFDGYLEYLSIWNDSIVVANMVEAIANSKTLPQNREGRIKCNPE